MMRERILSRNDHRAIVAHRGWSSKAPENTMAAFRLAADDARINWIELDVQLSKDGIPVVIHDFTLKRTTGVTGAVKNYTYQQLAALDNGSWFSKAYSEERIPALDQVLHEFKGRFRFNIELKIASGLYPGLERAAIETIRTHQLQSEVVITSFDHYAVQRARAIDPSVRAGLIISGLPVMLKEQLRFTGADFLSMDYHYLSAPLVSELIKSGYDIMAWTVNEPSAIERVVRLHPKLMICTNFPERVFPYLS